MFTEADFSNDPPMTRPLSRRRTFVVSVGNLEPRPTMKGTKREKEKTRNKSIKEKKIEKMFLYIQTDRQKRQSIRKRSLLTVTTATTALAGERVYIQLYRSHCSWSREERFSGASDVLHFLDVDIIEIYVFIYSRHMFVATLPVWHRGASSTTTESDKMRRKLDVKRRKKTIRWEELARDVDRIDQRKKRKNLKEK